MIPSEHARTGGPLAQCRTRDLVWLALTALALRVVYLIAGLSTQGLAGVALVAPDSAVYLQLADYFQTGEAEAGRHLLVAGPGYPLLLAALSMLFGPGLWPPVLLNILLALAAPVGVYLLALTLFNDRAVALISGSIVAFSFTGTSLATSLLTDQPYYTLHTLALLAFVLGLKTGRNRWFVAAGLLAAVATAVRAIGQLWPYMFLALAALWVLSCPPPRPWRRLVKSLWTPAIMLVMILSWSAVNQARYGVFLFTSNGVRASWAYLTPMAVADHTPGGNLDSVRAAWSTEVLAPVDGRDPSEAEVLGRMRSRVIDVVSEHADWVAQSFLLTVWRNIRAPNYFADAQVPRGKSVWAPLIRACHDWISPLLLVLALAALGLLAVQGRRESLLVLGLTYGYFTLMTGFSFWQGSRLHYPAEMAWAVLVSYLCVTAWRYLDRGRYRADGTASV